MLAHIENKLKIRINQPDLIQTAFRHSSFVNEGKRQHLENNERLEFLGDAVLEMITSHYLYQHYPEQPEGVLTRMRASLVQEESLAYLAKKNNFDRYLQLGRGEEASGGRKRSSILADCFEAFIGAIYLDQGYAVIEQFLMDELLENHQDLIGDAQMDYKTAFQERVQQKGSVKIDYQIIESSGPAHAMTFTSAVYVNGQQLAIGTGKTKKAAERQAAKMALALVDEDGNIHVSE